MHKNRDETTSKYICNFRKNNVRNIWGQLYDVITNLETKEISLIERIIPLMNVNLNPSESAINFS